MTEQEIRKSMREAGSLIFDALGVMISKLLCGETDRTRVPLKEAAALLNYESEDYVRSLCRKGKLKGAFQDGNRWFVDMTK